MTVKRKGQLYHHAYYEKLRLHLLSKLGGKCVECGIDDPRCLVVVPDREGVKTPRGLNGAKRTRLMLEAPAGDYKVLCANHKAIGEYLARSGDPGADAWAEGKDEGTDRV